MNWLPCSVGILNREVSPEERNTLFRIALGMTKGMTAPVARRIQETGMSAEEFFGRDSHELVRILGLNGNLRFDDKCRQDALSRAGVEIDFVGRHSIRVYSLLDDDYPWLLREIPDAPVTLYQLGETDLNSPHSASVVGTRRCTSYGLNFSKDFVTDLGGYFPDLNVVSGLAYGIDAAAHQAALDSGISTVAVMAHGLDTIYPARNRDLAKRIIRSGGSILSEYPSGSAPYAGRFLERNRIVAGLSHITVVVESEIKGGAMSTANLAFSYDREVMALPGRACDRMSAGCNHLIRKEKARLISAAADVIEIMDWRPLDVKIEPRQRNLFPELEGTASRIYEILKFESEPIAVDSLFVRTGISIPELMATLTELEFDGIISREAGNRYCIS